MPKNQENKSQYIAVPQGGETLFYPIVKIEEVNDSIYVTYLLAKGVEGHMILASREHLYDSVDNAALIGQRKIS